MEFNKNISFSLFFIFILIILIFGNQNIAYIDNSEYLMNNEFLFVDIRNSKLQNKLIFFILFFIPLNLIIVFNKFKKKYIEIISIVSFTLFILTFFNYYIYINKIIYSSIILLILFFIFSQILNFNFKIYFKNKKITIDHIFFLILFILICYIYYFPIFYTYDLDIFLSYFNIHNYSLSGIFSYNEKSNFINTNYYNNFYNFLFKIFYSLIYFKFPININIFILVISSIIFYIYFKIIFYCNKNIKQRLLSILFLIIAISYIYNFNNPSLQLSFRYLIVFIYLFLIIKTKYINYFNLNIFLISIVSFFNNIESFLIINFLNFLLFLNFKNSFLKNTIKYVFFLLLTLISIYLLIKFLNLFFYFDLSIYKNIIVGTTNGFARSFPRLDNFSLTIFIILSHSCSLIIFDFKNLLFKKNILSNKKMINIFLSIIILYFSIFYFRRGYDTVHTDMLFLSYFIILSQQMNLVFRLITRRKKINKLNLYWINFFDFSIYFTKFNFFNYFNIKGINIFSFKIFFILSILLAFITQQEFLIRTSSFDKFQLKNYSNIVAKNNAELLLSHINTIISSDIEIDTTLKSKTTLDIKNLNEALNINDTKSIIYQTDILFKSPLFTNHRYQSPLLINESSKISLIMNNPLNEINNFFVNNNIQTTFTGYNYHRNIIDYDYIFGVTRDSNVMSHNFELPLEYRDNLKKIYNILPNFDIFTKIKYNNIAGFNIPNLDYSIIKKKADFLKNKNFYYISDYSFFISLYNNETTDFYFMEPFNDLLTKDAFNNYIKKLNKSKTTIAIDCLGHMANGRGKNFYNLFINELLENQYYIREACTDEGFTILKKKL